MNPTYEVQRRYRTLDIDDLLVLKLFSESYPLDDIARALSVTVPAIHARLKKYPAIWEGFQFKAQKRGQRDLVPEAIAAGEWAKQFLDALV